MSTLVAKDGRELAFLEVGNPKGPLVIHNHGGPSSRLEANLLKETALKHGLRLLCVDRPGIGKSSIQQERTYSGWADDLSTIADSLGYQEFGVTGWSEGGPWALAAAAYIDSSRLRHVSAIAGGSYGAFGDNWAKDQLSKVDAMGGFLALHFKPGFQLMYELLALTAEHFRSSYFKQLLQAVNEYDRQILLRPGFQEMFCEASAECFVQGSQGLVRDSELLYKTWDFDVRLIHRCVHIWQGLDDRLVPDFINKQVSEQMPGAVWHPVEQAGHFVAIGSADDIFKVAAEELSSR
ncbi:MAG: alpha/beta fold hydrolase [Spartobacteria bacterium]